MASGCVRNEGADLVYDRDGAGPPLLLIAGGTGDAGQFASIVPLLGERFTVLRYDRRAEGRSSGDPFAVFDMARQARDAAAVIRAAGAGPMLVFGTSAGANIGLKLAEDHPALVRALIVHEPPVTTLLPPADQGLDFIDEVEALLAARGPAAAMRRIVRSLQGVRLTPQLPSVRMASLERFIGHEFRAISLYRPDLTRLRTFGVPIVTAAGAASGDAPYARTARFIATALPCRLAMLPGHHLAFVADPLPFAHALRALLSEM